MKRETIQGRNGYDIPCINNMKSSDKSVVIISHGLGSSKESTTAKAITSALLENGIGAFCYDFPAHGESPVDGEYFTINNCLNDLASVENHLRQQLPNAKISYFSSSFGAYINLIYLSTRPHTGIKSFLRCAAIDLPGIFRDESTPEIDNLLSTQGYILLDKNYFRPLKITKHFCDELESHDLFELYKPSNTELIMIHGDADNTASITDARRFAKQFGINLKEVKGADHQFLIPGGMDQVVDMAIDFFIT